MTLKPSRKVAFVRRSASAFITLSVISFIGSDLTGIESLAPHLMFGLFAGLAFGLVAAVFLTPGEIHWDEDTFGIKTLFSKSEYRWDDLVAYSTWNLFIRFDGRPTHQIDPSGFDSGSLKELRQFLRQKFPGKETKLWLGSLPVGAGGK